MRKIREEAIIQILQSRLASDIRTWDQTIDVMIDGEEIMLVGTVDNDNQRKAAEIIAVSVCGISYVTNNISIRKTRHAI